MKKKLFALALSLICLLSLACCGLVSAETETADDYLASISGTYVELFPELSKEEYRSIWLAATTPLVGEENARIRSVPEMGTEDMGYFMEGRPGCYCYFGFGDGQKDCVWPAHSPHYRVDEGGLTYAAALHVQVVLDYLNGAN